MLQTWAIDTKTVAAEGEYLSTRGLHRAFWQIFLGTNMFNESADDFLNEL